jgi:hypothetical protein
MIKPEETTIKIFNKALKKLMFFNIPVTKEQAKEFSLMDVQLILENLTLAAEVNNIHIDEFNDSIKYFNRVKNLIHTL